MSELGRLLEVIHGAEPPAAPVRLVVRTWTHTERSLEAWQAGHEGGGWVAYGPVDTEEPPPPESAEELRIWLDGDSAREERGDGRLAVARGALWWRYDPEDGAVTNEGEPEVRTDIGRESQIVLDPARFLGVLRLAPAGAGEVAGRPTLRARARPRLRGDDRTEAWALHELGWGAEECELEFDAGQGWLLRAEAIRGGQPFWTLEVAELVVGEPHPSGTFEFRPPSGETLRSFRDEVGETAHDLPVHELAARTPFPLFVAARVPPGWDLHSHWHSGSPRHGTGPQVTLQYLHPTRAQGFSLMQCAAGDEMAGWWREDPHDRVVERKGRRMRVRDRSERMPQATVSLERDGTAIAVHATGLEAEDLLSIAAELVPAPERPQF